ncbi:MAG: hypothetical protein V4730_08340 [Pseudomonadota bacterium]
MKKLLLATLLMSSSAFADNSALTAEFTAGYIPMQDVKLKALGVAATLENDGYFFRAALNDGKFRAFGSMQQVEGSTCGTVCISHELTETRGGLAFTALDNGQLKVVPRVEYVTLERNVDGDVADVNGVAFGSDATLTLAPNLNIFGGASYIKLDDYKGPELILGATLKTEVVNLVVEGRHVKLKDSANDLEFTSNELKLGLQKSFDF